MQKIQHQLLTIQRQTLNSRCWTSCGCFTLHEELTAVKIESENHIQCSAVSVQLIHYYAGEDIKLSGNI